MMRPLFLAALLVGLPLVACEELQYVFHAEAKTWVQAEAACQEDGGTLAMPHSLEENEASRQAAAGVVRFWLGFTDAATEGTFVGVDGGALLWTNWGSGEPNDHDNVGLPPGEDCAHMWQSDGAWNDVPCSLSLPFVCEVPTCGCKVLFNQASPDDVEFCSEDRSQQGQVDACYPRNWDGGCDSNKSPCRGPLPLAPCESTSFRNGAQPWDELLCYQDHQRQYLQPTQGCSVELCINCDLAKCPGDPGYEDCTEKEEWRCCMSKTECPDHMSPEECFDWKRITCDQEGVPLACDVAHCAGAGDPAACRATERMVCCVQEAVECLLCTEPGCQELCWEDKREECCAIMGIGDDETCDAVVLWTTTTTSISSTTSGTTTTATTTSATTTSATTITTTATTTSGTTTTGTTITTTATTTSGTTITTTGTTTSGTTVTTTGTTTSGTTTTRTTITTTATTTSGTTTTPEANVLLFRARGSSSSFENDWPYWYRAGGRSNKRLAYEGTPLVRLRFQDDSGRFAEYRLNGGYRGLTLLEIVRQCMPPSVVAAGNDGGAAWTAGRCPNVGTLVDSSGTFTPDPLSSVLRIGVGDATADRGDWALFMPVVGNAWQGSFGDFNGRGVWAFGSERRTNTGHDGYVEIWGAASV